MTDTSGDEETYDDKDIINNIFTNVTDLDKQEPEARRPRVMKCPFEDTQKKLCVDTPVSLLRSAVLMRYNAEPDMMGIQLPCGKFEAKYTVHGVTGVGTAINKRRAKQIAARECLYALINADLHTELCIPGNDKEAALRYVSNLGFESETEGPNWISKCYELCAKKKIPVPQLQCSEMTEMNLPMHFCETTFEDRFIRCGSRTKKDARNQVFAEIFPILKNMPSKDCKKITPPPTSDPSGPMPPIEDGITAVELAVYLDHVVRNKPSHEDLQITDYKHAIDVISRFRNPNGEPLFEGYDYLILSSPDKPVMIGVLNLDGLLMGEGSTNKAMRRDHSFHGIDQNKDMKVVYEEASWRALEFIHNYGNFRTNMGKSADELKATESLIQSNDSSPTKSEVDAVGLRQVEKPWAPAFQPLSSTASPLPPTELKILWDLVHTKLDPVQN